MNNENQVSVNNLISQENSVEVSTTSKNECFDVEQNINSYYSNLAKSWACKEDNMVDGEYFSAKYYAKSAQKYLEDFKNYSEKYLNHLQITNCLLEVPQNIKLELNNGVLTLKAGSKAPRISSSNLSLYDQFPSWPRGLWPVQGSPMQWFSLTFFMLRCSSTSSSLDLVVLSFISLTCFHFHFFFFSSICWHCPFRQLS